VSSGHRFLVSVNLLLDELCMRLIIINNADDLNACLLSDRLNNPIFLLLVQLPSFKRNGNLRVPEKLLGFQKLSDNRIEQFLKRQIPVQNQIDTIFITLYYYLL